MLCQISLLIRCSFDATFIADACLSFPLCLAMFTPIAMLFFEAVDFLLMSPVAWCLFAPRLFFYFFAAMLIIWWRYDVCRCALLRSAAERRATPPVADTIFCLFSICCLLILYSVPPVDAAALSLLRCFTWYIDMMSDVFFSLYMFYIRLRRLLPRCSPTCCLCCCYLRALMPDGALPYMREMLSICFRATPSPPHMPRVIYAHICLMLYAARLTFMLMLPGFVCWAAARLDAMPPMFALIVLLRYTGSLVVFLRALRQSYGALVSVVLIHHWCLLFACLRRLMPSPYRVALFCCLLLMLLDIFLPPLCCFERYARCYFSIITDDICWRALLFAKERHMPSACSVLIHISFIARWLFLLIRRYLMLFVEIFWCWCCLRSLLPVSILPLPYCHTYFFMLMRCAFCRDERKMSSRRERYICLARHIIY